jgi:hypothetical protein
MVALPVQLKVNPALLCLTLHRAFNGNESYRFRRTLEKKGGSK